MGPRVALNRLGFPFQPVLAYWNYHFRPSLPASLSSYDAEREQELSSCTIGAILQGFEHGICNVNVPILLMSHDIIFTFHILWWTFPTRDHFPFEQFCAK